MSNLKVQTEKLKASASSIRYITSKINEIYNEYRSITYALDYDIKSRQGINRSMHESLQGLEDIEDIADNLSRFLSGSIDTYQKAEEDLIKMFAQLDDETLGSETQNDTETRSTSTTNYHDMYGPTRYYQRVDLFDTYYDNYGGSSTQKNDPQYTKQQIIDLKRTMKEIFQDYPEIDIPVENSDGEIDAILDEEFEEVAIWFLRIYDSYIGRSYSEFAYEAIDEKYKLMVLMHWVDLIKEGEQIDPTNIFPDEYYDAIPSLPLTDSKLGPITPENKYLSKDALAYYEKYLYPMDAMYEVNFHNFPRDAMIVNYDVWARYTYGSNKAEEKDEFVFGAFWGVATLPLKAVLDTVEGIYSVFVNYDQILPFMGFFVQLPFSKEKQVILAQMVDQAIEEWKLAYGDAEPFEKGRMISSLIGETLVMAVEAGAALKGAASLMKFVKNGGFRQACKQVLKLGPTAKKLMTMKPHELLSAVKKLVKRTDGYEFIMLNDEVVYIPLDDLSSVHIQRYDNLIDQRMKRDVIPDDWDGLYGDGKHGNNISDDVDIEGTSNLRINPLDNPKIAKDIAADSDAVYGYVPKEGSSLEKFGIDWTNPDEVARARAARLEYLEAMEIKRSKINSKVDKYLSEGKEMKEIAEIMVDKRNADRINSYIARGDSDGLELLYERNLKEYGKKEGPSLEFLYNKNGSYEEVIYSSLRVNLGMNVLLGID